MKDIRVRGIGVLMLACALGAFPSCSSKPMTVCTVTPIDIEELKADGRDLDIDLAAVRERLAVAEADLAGWKQRVAETRQKPPELLLELVRLKKMSGRTEKVENTPEPKAQQAKRGQ